MVKDLDRFFKKPLSHCDLVLHIIIASNGICDGFNAGLLTAAADLAAQGDFAVDRADGDIRVGRRVIVGAALDGAADLLRQRPISVGLPLVARITGILGHVRGLIQQAIRPSAIGHGSLGWIGIVVIAAALKDEGQNTGRQRQ